MLLSGVASGCWCHVDGVGAVTLAWAGLTVGLAVCLHHLVGEPIFHVVGFAYLSCWVHLGLGWAHLVLGSLGLGWAQPVLLVGPILIWVWLILF